MAARELRGRLREPRVSVRRKLRQRGRVEQSLLASRRALCRWGLCPEFAEVGGLCNSHDQSSRRALQRAVAAQERGTPAARWGEGPSPESLACGQAAGDRWVAGGSLSEVPA